jgi:two-component system chemotaxis response regulator CheB
VINVLVVDDSALLRKLLGKVLASDPQFNVAFARNGVEALEQLESFQPDVITLDVHMPQMDGLACLDRIMVQRPCPVVMVSSLTAEGADETLEAFRLGAVDFVPKPEGAVSLHMEVFAPQFLSKVRAAAGARIKTSARLRERIQHRLGTLGRPRYPGVAAKAAGAPATGTGIVVVGTSTGGPPALEALLIPLAASFPWPIVIAQHMPASFTGPLARRLDKLCAIGVREVAPACVLEPGHAYIGRGDADVTVVRQAGLVSAVSTPSDASLWHPSTNRLVRSAMSVFEPAQIIGVLMTGMGNDGADAMTQLHALGGRTIAEAEETAVVWGMPGELAKAGGADWVVPLPQIADRLQQLVPIHASHSKRV